MLKHSGNSSLHVGIQSYNDLKSTERDVNDRVLLRVGRKLCIMDPENGKQLFLNASPVDGHREIKNVLHFSFSRNMKFICVCESTRFDRAHQHNAVASLYNINTLNRVKCIQNSYAGSGASTSEASGEYIYSSFCGDGKNLVLALKLDDDERHDAMTIQIWDYQKERLFKSCIVPSKVSKICAAPALCMVTTSGQSLCKSWYVAADATLKSANLLPPAKETPEYFLDHVWLSSNGTEHRMIALAETDSLSSSSVGQSVGKGSSIVSDEASLSQHSKDGSTCKTPASLLLGQKVGRQSLFLFEGIELPLGTAGPPISLELKNTIVLKPEQNCRVTCVIATNKGFICGGSQGFVMFFEKTDDKREPYQEVRRVLLGDFLIIGLTLVPSEERLIMLSSLSRVLSVSMDAVMRPPQIHDQTNARDTGYDGDGSVSKKSNASAQSNNDELAIRCTDLLPGGFHMPVGQDVAIVAADASYQRSMIITIGNDRTARMWNTVTHKCVFIHDLRSDSPTAVALHHTGNTVLVAFKDKIRVYHVLVDKLKLYRDVLVKNCKDIKYSNGGKYFAAAASVNVFLYDASRYTQLMNFQGHMMTVKCLYWSANDDVLFSAGMDGNVYGWPLFSSERIDIMTASSRSSAIISMSSFSNSAPLYTRQEEDEEEMGTNNQGEDGEGVVMNAQARDDMIIKSFDRVILTTMDGSIRCPVWTFPNNPHIRLASDTPPYTTSPFNLKMRALKGDTSSASGADGIMVNMTSALLSIDKRFLYCGTNIGSIRVYNWPVSDSAGYFELYTQAGAVIAIRESPSGKTLTAVSTDGTICLFDNVRSRAVEEFDTGLDVLGIVDDGSDEIGNPEDGYNHDLLQITSEDLDHYMNEIAEMQKKLSESQAKFEFELHSLESSHQETSKKNAEKHDKALSVEKDRYDNLQLQFDGRVRELLSIIAEKESGFVKVNAELENRYEHKLADQFDRYDRLCEEMEQLKQRCESLVSMERSQFEKKISQLKNESKHTEKRLNADIKRIKDERHADENAFKEILDQQEDEYEDELRQLIGAAESELSGERDTIMKLRTMVQTKNTKLDQLKTKLIEITNASKQRLGLLRKEKDEKIKLQNTIAHYKNNLMEREAALAEKEKVILELRNTTRTLENFRFVLDNRLQQLFAERGPITSHIEDLENHISSMYEELVGEFDNKNAVMNQNEVKEKRLQFMSAEINTLRRDRKEKELYITAFKRELNNIVSSNTQGKDLEESIRLLYRKYVRGETVNDKMTKSSDEVANKAKSLIKNGNQQTKKESQGRIPLKDHGDKTANANSGVNNGVGISVGGSGVATGVTSHDAKLQRQFVKDVEEELIETAKEADRRKEFVEKAASQTAMRLKRVQDESNRQMQKRLMENSNLMFECNNLRREKKELQRKIGMLQDTNTKMQQAMQGASSLTHASGAGENDSSQYLENSDEVSAGEVSSLGGSIRKTAYADVDNQIKNGGSLNGRVLQHSESAPVIVDTGDRVPNQGGMLQQPGKLARNISTPGEGLGSIRGGKMNIKIGNKLKVKLPGTNQATKGGISANNESSLLNKLSTQNYSSAISTSSIDVHNAYQKKVGKSTGGPNGVAHQMGKMQNEIEMLHTELDMSHREKDMQRMEISRLRNQLVKLAGLTQISSSEPVNLPTLQDYINNGGGDIGGSAQDQFYVPGNMKGVDAGGSVELGDALSVSSANRQSKSRNRSSSPTKIVHSTPSIPSPGKDEGERDEQSVE